MSGARMNKAATDWADAHSRSLGDEYDASYAAIANALRIAELRGRAAERLDADRLLRAFNLDPERCRKNGALDVSLVVDGIKTAVESGEAPT